MKLFKKILPIVFGAISLFGLSTPSEAQITDTAVYVNNLLGAGFNGYYSWQHYDNDFDWIDWDLMSETGFESVRLVFIESQTLSNISSAHLDEIQDAVDAALANNLLPIIDYHIARAWFTTNYTGAQRTIFLNNWGAIANRFSSYDFDEVVYELCNEPTESAVLTDWNALAADAVAAIRVYDYNKTIIIPVAHYASMRGVFDFELPDDDKLIMGIHYYASGWVQTQDCPWEDPEGSEDGPFYGLNYTGATWYNIDAMVDNLEYDFYPLWDWFEANDTVPVTIDEWGTMFYVDSTNRYNYSNYLTRWFDSKGFSHSVWELAGHFGIYNDPDLEITYDDGGARFIHKLDSAILIDNCPIYDYDIIDTLVAYDTTTTGWGTYETGGGGVSISIVDYELRANVYSTDYNQLNARVYSPYFTFVEDHIYRISFTVRASASKDWAVKLSEDIDHYQYDWIRFENTDTESLEWVHTYIYPEVDDYTRLEFLLGGSTGYFYIEDFLIEELSPVMGTVLYTLGTADPDPDPVDLDTLWFAEADSYHKAAITTSVACDESALEFETGYIEGGWDDSTLIGALNFNWYGESAAGYDDVSGDQIHDLDSVQFTAVQTEDIYFINQPLGLWGGTNGMIGDEWPFNVTYYDHHFYDDTVYCYIRGDSLFNDRRYDVAVLSSVNSVDSRSFIMRINDQYSTINPANNQNDRTIITNIQPVNNEILVRFDGVGTTPAFINGLWLYERTQQEASNDPSQAYAKFDNLNFGSTGYDSLYIEIEHAKTIGQTSSYITLDSLDGDTISTITVPSLGCAEQFVILDETVTGIHDLYATIDSLDIYTYMLFDGYEAQTGNRVRLNFYRAAVPKTLFRTATEIQGWRTSLDWIVEAGAPQTICVSGTASVTGTQTGSDSTQWWTSGTGTFNDGEELNAIYTPSAADTVAGSVILTLVGYRGATPDSTSDNFTLTLYPLPLADAGDNDTIAVDGSIQISDAVATHETYIIWTTYDGAGSFNNDNLENPTYSPGAADEATGTIHLVMSVNSAYCSSYVRDTMALVITEAVGLSWEGPADPDLDNLVTIYVTDTTDSGTEGSLRYALEYNGRRRIIPTISGTVELLAHVEIENPHMWYDGASGPSPGLLVIRGAIWIKTTDVVITHLHVRLGDDFNGGGNNCISILHGSQDVVIDHCSLLWGVDQIMGTNPYFGGPGTVADLERITITNNIISQGLSYADHDDGEHSKGPLIYYDSEDVLVAYNLMVQNRDRNPLFEGGATGQIIGNMCYWGYQPMSICFQSRPSHIGGGSVYHTLDIMSNKSSGYREQWQIRFYDFDEVNSRIYMEGNNGANDDWDTDSIWGSPYESTVRVHSPNFDYGVTVRTASEAQTYVLENAGAFPDDRGVTDQRVIDTFINKPYGDEFYSLGEGNENLIDSQDDLGWDLFPLYNP